MDNIIKLLQNTRAEHPIDGDDVDAWVDRLTNLSDEVNTHREASNPTLLSERQAEVVVRWYGMGQSAEEIADVLDIGTPSVYDIRHAAEDNLLAADATLSLISKLRESIRPDPYGDNGPDIIATGEMIDEPPEHPQPAVDVIAASPISLASVVGEWRPEEDRHSVDEYDIREHPEVWKKRTLPRRFRHLSPSDFTASVRLPEEAADINLSELAVLSGTLGGDPAEIQRVSYDPTTLDAVVCESKSATVVIVENGFVVVGDGADSVRTATEDALSMIGRCMDTVGIELKGNEEFADIMDALEISRVGDIAGSQEVENGD